MKVLAERPKPATNAAENAIPKTARAGPALSDQALTPWLVVVVVVVLFSGGLSGYDQGVISGALHGIKATFSLSALLVEVVTSWVTLGALLGALAAGELARPDRPQANRTDRGCDVHAGRRRAGVGT